MGPQPGWGKCVRKTGQGQGLEGMLGWSSKYKGPGAGRGSEAPSVVVGRPGLSPWAVHGEQQDRVFPASLRGWVIWLQRPLPTPHRRSGTCWPAVQPWLSCPRSRSPARPSGTGYSWALLSRACSGISCDSMLRHGCQPPRACRSSWTTWLGPWSLRPPSTCWNRHPRGTSSSSTRPAATSSLGASGTRPSSRLATLPC